MALIKCPDCCKDISKRADFCPHCGCPSKYFNINTNKLVLHRTI